MLAYFSILRDATANFYFKWSILIFNLYVMCLCRNQFSETGTTLHYSTLHYTLVTILHYTTSTLQFTILHCTALYYTTLHYTVLHYTALHYTTLHYTTLHYTTLYYTILHYTSLYYTTMHYTTLHYNNNMYFIYKILEQGVQTRCVICLQILVSSAYSAIFVPGETCS